MFLGRRNVKITSEIVMECFLGAVILTGDLSDVRTVISGELRPLGELISCAVTSFLHQKLKTNEFRNNLGTGGSLSKGHNLAKGPRKRTRGCIGLPPAKPDTKGPKDSKRADRMQDFHPEASHLSNCKQPDLMTTRPGF